MSSDSAAPPASVTAAYQSPTDSHVFQHTLTSPPPQQTPVDVVAKTNYLSELRASAKKLQEDINVFLTEKMDEDKKAAAATDQNTSRGSKAATSTDEQDEANYGEEVVEED